MRWLLKPLGLIKIAGRDLLFLAGLALALFYAWKLFWIIIHGVLGLFFTAVALSALAGSALLLCYIVLQFILPKEDR